MYSTAKALYTVYRTTETENKKEMIGKSFETTPKHWSRGDIRWQTVQRQLLPPE